MNKYFKPLDWEINDYISYINEPTSIDLSPYLNYITEDYNTKDDLDSQSDPEGGELEFEVSKQAPITSVLPPKESLPEYKPVVIPKEDTKGKSTIVPINKTDFKTRKEFINYFASLYKSEGLNDDLALTLAKQDALESWTKNGLSRLAREGHNYGGIKSFDKNVPSINLGTHEYINGRYVYMDPKKDSEATRFRVFKDASDYVRYKVKWMSTSSKYKGALSGDGDHYLSVITGNNPGGWKYATAPNYKEVIKGIKAKSGGVLIAKNGIPLRNSYNDKDRYDYSGSDYIPPKDEHWPSRNPKTGLLLKHPNHETYDKMIYGEFDQGLRRFKDTITGREYSFNDFEASTRGLMPGMKEIGYSDREKSLPISEFKEVFLDKSGLAERYYKKLRSEGLGEVQAAAILGVMMQESGLNHDAVSSKDARGVFQLLGSKKKMYDSWLRRNRKSDTAENQITFVIDYMATANDDWQDYYISLSDSAENDFKNLPKDQREKAKDDWEKMKDSKYIDYNYDVFRDMFYDLDNIEDAVDMFTYTFERPKEFEANMDARNRYANAAYNYFKHIDKHGK